MKKIEKKYSYLVIDGEYYTLDQKDGKPSFVKIAKSKVRAIEKKVERIAERMKEGLDSKAVLVEALMNLDIKDIDKMENLLFKSKRKYKPVTRKHHCVDMKVGRMIIPIVD